MLARHSYLDGSLPGASVIALLVVLLVALGTFVHNSGTTTPRAWEHGAVSLRANQHAAGFRTYRYVTGAKGRHLLRPIDPRTLAYLKRQPSISLGHAAFAASNRDGSVIITIEGADAQDVQASNETIRVIDARANSQLAQFHPPVPVWISDVSADGSELLSRPLQQDQPLYVLGATNGRLLATIRVPAIRADLPCCFQPLFDPAGRRLYILDAPLDQAFSKSPPTVSLVAYDLPSGVQVSHVALDGLFAGSWWTGRMVGYHLMNVWSPGFALSPDGRTIAIFDGHDSVLRLIDARTLKIVTTLTVARPKGLWQRFMEGLGLEPSTAYAAAAVGRLLRLAYSSDGRILYVTGEDMRLYGHNKFSFSGIGIERIDAATGKLVADTPGDKSIWMLTAPDSSAIYSTTLDCKNNGHTCSTTYFERHQGTNLRVTARRVLKGSLTLYMQTVRPGIVARRQAGSQQGRKQAS